MTGYKTSFNPTEDSSLNLQHSLAPATLTPMFTKVPMDAPRPQITNTSAGVEDDVGDLSGAADNGQQTHFLPRDIWRPWT